MEMEVPIENNLSMYGGGGDFTQSNQGSMNTSTFPNSTSNSRSKGGKENKRELLPRMLKIAVVGDSTCGKTSICQGFSKLPHHYFSTKYTMTFGVDIFGKSIPVPTEDGTQNDVLNMILLDSSGKDIFSTLLPKYWEKLDGACIVIDVTSGIALDRVGVWMEMVKSAASSGDKFIGPVLIGNKIDLEDQRSVSGEALEAFAKQNRLQYFECSAKENRGLQEPFHYIANQWVQLPLGKDRKERK